MEYRALYRQFRPDTFEEVVGQQAVVRTLKNQVTSGRIAHAYLFTGPRGTGKTTSAKIFARAINCQNPQAGDPCGVCDACVSLAQANNMDVLEIDAASNNGVDEIRDLRDKVRFPPSVGRYKVYIIDEVHMLSSGAFNALLKTLEEPPEHAVFILATTEAYRLPATILSRCQRFDFHRLTSEIIAARLSDVLQRAGAQMEEAAIRRIARQAEGGMRDALSIAEQCLSFGEGLITEQDVIRMLGTADDAFYFDLAEHLLKHESSEVLAAIDRAMADGQDPGVLAASLARHMRNVLAALYVSDAAALLDLSQEQAQQLKAQANSAPAAALMRAANALLLLEGELRWAGQPRLTLELCLLRLCRPDSEQDLDALAQRVALLEQRLEKGEFTLSSAPAGAAAPSQTQAVAEKPASAPLPAATADQGAPKTQLPAEIWKGMLSILKKESPGLYAQAKGISPAGMAADGRLSLRADGPENQIFLDILMGDRNRPIIENALSQAAGKPIALATKGASAVPAQKKSSGLYERAVEIFGADKVVRG